MSLPRNLQLRNHLFDLWKRRGIEIGEKIESQNEILNFCPFSLSTVLRTLNDLESEGTIERRLGSGSYLLKKPWRAKHLRIGFFYNRQIAKSGIFSNPYYQAMLIEFEKQVLLNGDEFSFGSFTRDEMPTELWDHLDAIIMTGLIKDFDASKITTSTSLSMIDTEGFDLLGDSFYLDFNKAYENLFNYCKKKKIRKVLYVDSVFKTKQQEKRRKLFHKYFTNNEFDKSIIKGDVEFGIHDTTKLLTKIESIQPQIVFGYIHFEWQQLIQKHFKHKILTLCLNTSKNIRPSFYINMSEWVGEVLNQIKNRSVDRQLDFISNPYSVELKISKN